MQRGDQPPSDDLATGRLEVAFDPTLPAPATPGPVVKSSPRNNGLPLGLVGRFQNIRRIGAGGMGVVYRAFDPKLGRDVALKLLKHGDAESWSRFLGEARAQARVEHDNICRVYEVGEVDGEPFIVMQLIEGEPLTVARGGMDVRQRVIIMQQVANAVQAAHTRGLVHRDIKPSNILVETREDGSFRPYIVDFGIARDIARNAAHTLEGMIGTPAYLAPEVATQRERLIVDARIDVYGLGATLYDIIAGRPPYVGQDAWHILERLMKEDPPPLRAITKRISAELEAIVMKCLERDPTRRYPTAGALADDLRRYLEGEPITARRVGLAYALRRMARKHGRWALATFVVLTFATAFAITQRNAAAQAELAQDLGRTVTEMELYMRTAYQMPAHDIERERTVVREQIKQLEKRVRDAETTKDGAVLYALGRAYLALGDHEQACTYLERAAGVGYASPELGYAFSIAQIRAYWQRRDNVEWYRADPNQRKIEIEALDTRYLKPAFERLRNVEPGRIEHPAYAAALVAANELRREDALNKAREAFAHAPLLYEAKLVEADALVGLALPHWQSGKSDWWEKLSAGMEEAFNAYAGAENIARSDPRILIQHCKARTTHMYAAFSSQKVPTRPYFNAAREVCDRLIVVDPSGAESRVWRAAMYSLHAFALAQSDGTNEDPLQILEEAAIIAEDAKRISTGALPAYEALGNTLRARARVLVDRGLDATAALDRAERHYDEARSIYKHDMNLRDAIANVYQIRTEYEGRRGMDTIEVAKRSDQMVDELLAANHLVMMAWRKRAGMYLVRAEQQWDRGQSSPKWIDVALEALNKAKENNPAFTVADLRFLTFALTGQYAHALGNSARETIDRMRIDMDELIKEGPEDVANLDALGKLSLLEAEEQKFTGGNPQPFIDRAREAFRKASTHFPGSVELAAQWARAELVAAKLAMAKKTATKSTFEAIRAPLESWLTDKLVYPEAHAIVAESYAMASEWRNDQGQSPEDDVNAGLAMVERALATNPKHAKAWAARGQLWLSRARATKDKNARANAGKSAIAAFEEAFRCNPLLERTFRKALIEAQQIR